MALLKENHEELRQREERDSRLLINGDRTGQEVVIFNLRQDLRLAEEHSAKIKEEVFAFIFKKFSFPFEWRQTVT